VLDVDGCEGARGRLFADGVAEFGPGEVDLKSEALGGVDVLDGAVGWMWGGCVGW